jgi:6,7-dimethyl-8-ribityllumazine synthase
MLATARQLDGVAAFCGFKVAMAYAPGRLNLPEVGQKTQKIDQKKFDGVCCLRTVYEGS